VFSTDVWQHQFDVSFVAPTERHQTIAQHDTLRHIVCRLWGSTTANVCHELQHVCNAHRQPFHNQTCWQNDSIFGLQYTTVKIVEKILKVSSSKLDFIGCYWTAALYKPCILASQKVRLGLVRPLLKCGLLICKSYNRYKRIMVRFSGTSRPKVMVMVTVLSTSTSTF